MGGFQGFTEEQQDFLNKAREGKNILVEACIGSGKTTVIQEFCRSLSPELWDSVKMLYLTYNKSLKDEARRKIGSYYWVDVQNYNSFALAHLETKVAPQEQISTFLEKRPKISKYDILIIDEYQDIKEEHAELLKYIKETNPNIQIIAVGDMKQKIYDFTRLSVYDFIISFLGDFEIIEFTTCFRLSSEYAKQLGSIWKKNIKGVNDDCKISIMTKKEVIDFLIDKESGKILCLGSNTAYGDRNYILNALEKIRPDKFNKQTVFSKISDSESVKEIKRDTAIFDTFDGCKGLEREICVIADFTEENWEQRASKPNQRYEILRNIFLVAASRGKKNIIFVEPYKNCLLDLNGKTLRTTFENGALSDVVISEMYDFKYIEDIEELYSCIDIKEIVQKDNSEIKVKTMDGYIDLSPCIGIFQEFMFFNNQKIDDTISFLKLNSSNGYLLEDLTGLESLEKKILYLTAVETGANRYKNQVKMPFISEESKEEIFKRLSVHLSRDDQTQVECEIPFYSKNGEHIFTAKGRLDVLKKDIVYELKFVSELTHTHFLQCATYVYATGKKKGILWNTRTNKMYEVKINGRKKKKFMNLMAKTITKGVLEKYYIPKKK